MLSYSILVFCVGTGRWVIWMLTFHLYLGDCFNPFVVLVIQRGFAMTGSVESPNFGVVGFFARGLSKMTPISIGDVSGGVWVLKCSCVRVGV